MLLYTDIIRQFQSSRFGRSSFFASPLFSVGAIAAFVFAVVSNVIRMVAACNCELLVLKQRRCLMQQRALACFFRLQRRDFLSEFFELRHVGQGSACDNFHQAN